MSRAFPLSLARLLGVLAVCSSAQALTFSEWQSVHFNAGQLANPALIAPAADPDGDDLSNLAEYVFTGDPLFADPGLLPYAGKSDGHLTLTYRERADLTGTEVWLQGGDDLTHWATFNTLEEIARVNGPDYADITLRDPFPIGPKRFLRLYFLLTPLPPLQAPANLALTVEDAVRVILRWSDLNVTETGYAVEKLDPVSQTWVRKATLGPDQTTWPDTELASYDGTAYRVVTLSEAGDLASDSARLPDSDQNGLSDWWELRYFGHTGVDLDLDSNGNGVANRLEYLEGTDPMLTVSGSLIAQLTWVQGTDQAPRPGEFLPLPWKIRVLHPDGSPLSGIPVRFTATPDMGLLAKEPAESSPLRPAWTVNSDANGYAQVWLKCL